MTKIPIWAGFECGEIEWPNPPLNKRQSFLEETGHIKNRQQNYQTVKNHGIHTIRDGLTISTTFDINKISKLVKTIGLDVFWDLHHYDFPSGITPFDTSFAVALQTEIYYHSVLTDENKFCFINEPTVMSHFCGETGEWYKNTKNRGFETLCNCVKVHLNTEREARKRIKNCKILYDDPFYGEPHEYAFLDMVLGRTWPQFEGHSNAIDIIGINFYPHLLKQKRLSDIIRETADRYEKPVAISETSWHTGYHETLKSEWSYWTKSTWLEYVLNECEHSGVDIQGICWYPIIDTPAWNELPGPVWSHGLIHLDGSLDEDLSNFIKQYNKI